MKQRIILMMLIMVCCVGQIGYAQLDDCQNRMDFQQDIKNGLINKSLADIFINGIIIDKAVVTLNQNSNDTLFIEKNLMLLIVYQDSKLFIYAFLIESTESAEADYQNINNNISMLGKYEIVLTSNDESYSSDILSNLFSYEFYIVEDVPDNFYCEGEFGNYKSCKVDFVACLPGCGAGGDYFIDFKNKYQIFNQGDECGGITTKYDLSGNILDQKIDHNEYCD